jgi:hypothetical protein
MPRANRHYLPDQVWHITHRCHKKEFLLRFALDRPRWVNWLREAFKAANGGDGRRKMEEGRWKQLPFGEEESKEQKIKEQKKKWPALDGDRTSHLKAPTP